jgi:MFS family permease
MLTFGIVAASLTGWFYIRQAETAIVSAAGNPLLIRAAEDHAWRGMFLSVIYPGFIFCVGAFFLSETPRWLFQKGRSDEVYLALRRSCSEYEAQLEMREMEELALENQHQPISPSGSLLQRKYVVPFVLACVILACNQATGINSILGYLVVILKQAGMSATRATQGDLAVKVLNCAITVLAIALIDRKGRKFLLMFGTGGIVASLLAAALLFYGLKLQVRAEVHADRLVLASSTVHSWLGQEPRPLALMVLYSYGSGDKMAVLDGSEGDILKLEPEAQSGGSHLEIKRAMLGPVPNEKTGWLISACIALFVASFAIGPGVVVWLTLSELMPTRIRSAGMGIALLLNQGVSTLIAGVFLPTVSEYGYYVMLLFWAACTVIYFITAARFLPETKGKTLEEIERSFAPSVSTSLPR